MDHVKVEDSNSLPSVIYHQRTSEHDQKRRLNLVTCSLLCSFSSLLPTITFLYLLIDTDSWSSLLSLCYRWLEHNHWDVQVTRTVWWMMDLIDDNNSVILMVLASLSSTNIILSLMVTFTSITHSRRSFLVPWLLFNTINIFIIMLIFIVWTFLSFFISILLAIIFPVVAGTILGIWILIWKKIYAAHANFYRGNDWKQFRARDQRHRQVVSHHHHHHGRVQQKL